MTGTAERLAHIVAVRAELNSLVIGLSMIDLAGQWRSAAARVCAQELDQLAAEWSVVCAIVEGATVTGAPL
ncbi:MAG: hypothetical protein ACTJHU_04840 [Mycetocola sp.]